MSLALHVTCVEGVTHRLYFCTPMDGGIPQEATYRDINVYTHSSGAIHISDLLPQVAFHDWAVVSLND